jgi:hypothetical protein
LELGQVTLDPTVTLLNLGFVKAIRFQCHFERVSQNNEKLIAWVDR